MKKKIVFYDKYKRKHTQNIEAEPECGIDRCCHCGACLACDKDYKCYGSTRGEHEWIEHDPVDTSLTKWR